MPTFTLERAGAKHLRFTGDLLTSASSRDATSERWTDLVLYRTAASFYVVSVIGRTIHDGETDRHAAHVADGSDRVLAALQRRNGALTTLAKRLLADAVIRVLYRFLTKGRPEVTAHSEFVFRRNSFKHLCPSDRLWSSLLRNGPPRNMTRCKATAGSSNVRCDPKTTARAFLIRQIE